MSAPASIEPQVLNVVEAAIVAGLSRRALDKLLKSGKGPTFYMDGRRPKILRRELVNWIERRAAAWAEVPA